MYRIVKISDGKKEFYQVDIRFIFWWVTLEDCETAQDAEDYIRTKNPVKEVIKIVDTNKWYIKF